MMVKMTMMSDQSRRMIREKIKYLARILNEKRSFFVRDFLLIRNPRYLLPLLLALACPSKGFCQTIFEKKEGFTQESQEMTPEMHKYLLEVNRELRAAQDELHQLYSEVNELFNQGACPDQYHYLLSRINEVRTHIINVENSWRELSIQTGQIESYGLWHQPETTIGQLVMDYGSQDYVYLFSPEIASIRLSVGSNLLIPRASWEEMLEMILTQNGIGYAQLNPFLRQLFILKENRSNLQLITNRRKELELFPPSARVCFVLTPEAAEVRRSWIFLEKFVNPNTTSLQLIGRDILIIGQVAEVQDLLKLYDFIAANKGEKEFKVFPISRVDPDEMAKILAAIFDQTEAPIKTTIIEPQDRARGGPPGPGFPPSGPPPPRFRPSSGPSQESIEANGLKVIALGHLAQALFLVGTKEEIRKAEQIIRQVESQVGEAREKVIYWYTTKHSDPEELADVLQKIYLLMVMTGTGFSPGPGLPPFPPGVLPMGIGGPPPPPLAPPTAEQIADEIISKEIDLLPSELYQTSYYQQGNYVVNPAPIEPRRTKAPIYNKNRTNFIVDPKTGSIAMVVEADILPKLKELIKKLDVPKRMVQIEALLFERRINKQNNFGLNLLRIGDCASQKDFDCFRFNDPKIFPTGIVDFIFSRAKSCVLPAYDIAYRFLMNQDNIQINASPSVVAINQTPATIAIVEEISINTGVYNIETIGGVTLQEAFTRAQYGITIDITPTIHITSEEFDDSDEPNYVTLDTDLTFDTIQPGLTPERPDVTRRHITNEVRIPDGQTVILGGLRRKTTDDFKESIPFLGELPCLGKLFSFRELQDNEVEMFIFLTPTIISDPLFDFERIKCEEMKRRPGDIPEFLCSLVAARDMEKNRVLANSMQILFGPDPDRCYSPSYWRPSACDSASNLGWLVNGLPPCGEYDGR